MGEIYRWDDPEAVPRAHKEVIQPAAAEAVAEINLAAYRAGQQVAENIVAEVKAINDDQVFERSAPHADILIEQAQEMYRQLARDAFEEIRFRVHRMGR